MASTFGGYFGGPDFSSFRNPFQAPDGALTEPFDRNLFEQNDGRPAMGYYAAQNGTGNKAFSDWILKQQTPQRQQYEGAYAAKNDPTFGWTDYLAGWNPMEEYQQQTQGDRGASALQMSPWVKRFMG